MADLIGTIIVGGIILAIAIAVIVVAAKIFMMLLPVALVIAGLAFVCWLFTDHGPDIPRKIHSEKVLEQKVERYRNELQKDIHEEIYNVTRQKPGVNLRTLRPELDTAILIVAAAYHEALNDDDFTPLITSADDYEGHTEKSAHYSGAAVDFRIKDVGNLARRKQVAAYVSEQLGKRFTVLHEDIGKANEHLHIQLRSGSYNKNETWR